MSFDLRDTLTELDKERIKNYVLANGRSRTNPVPESFFVGVDTYLENWAKSKGKLYRFLGKQLMVEVPFIYTKNEEMLKREVKNLNYEHPFLNKLNDFLWHIFKKKEENQPIYYWDRNRRILVSTFEDSRCYVTGEFNDNIKIPKEEGNGRNTLQLSPGMKIFKAIQRVLTYFDAPKELMESYDDFRCKHSVITNDKVVNSTLVFSIHPLDFMTMSDNRLNWESCMSWMENGCYSLGTVEMMNSNNVICVYLKSNTDFIFDDAKYNDFKEKNTAIEDLQGYIWNNKKWRQLFYIEKDIICSGKSYPFYNEIFTKEALVYLRAFAQRNFNWGYKFGLEPYRDMKGVTNGNRMLIQKGFLRNNDPSRKNIVFDTKAMYNDLLNDSDFPYWCVRNAPNKRRVISYSGKATCLGCNTQINNKPENDYPYDYNERYYAKNRFCYKCLDNSYCDDCGQYFKEVYKYTYNNGERVVIKECCKDCWDKNIKVCPICNKNVMDLSSNGYRTNKYIFIYYPDNIEKHIAGFNTEEYPGQRNEAIGLKTYICSSCYDDPNITNTLEKKFNIPFMSSSSHYHGEIIIHSAKACDNNFYNNYKSYFRNGLKTAQYDSVEKLKKI